MAKYDYAIEVLRGRLGMLKYAPPKETIAFREVRQHKITQLEAAIKRLKDKP